jgi:hypothetical protein
MSYLALLWAEYLLYLAVLWAGFCHVVPGTDTTWNISTIEITDYGLGRWVSILGRGIWFSLQHHIHISNAVIKYKF